MHATGLGQRIGQRIGALGRAIDDEEVADAGIEQGRCHAARRATGPQQQGPALAQVQAVASVRSRTRPTPSVLSPSHPVPVRISVFTAPARRARSVSDVQIAAARPLCGSVTLAPTPPSAANSASRTSNCSGSASIVVYSSAIPVCLPNAAWMRATANARPDGRSRRIA
jgi:hypothetical protein